MAELLQILSSFIYNGKSLFPSKNRGFGGETTPKILWTLIFAYGGSSLAGNASIKPWTTKIGRGFLVDVGFETKKNRNFSRYISPHRPDAPIFRIFTVFALVPHMADVIKCAKFYRYRFVGVRPAGPRKSPFPYTLPHGSYNRASANALPVITVLYASRQHLFCSESI